jgi:hypothetical protein
MALPEFTNTPSAPPEDVIRLRERVSSLQREVIQMMGIKNTLTSLVKNLKDRNKFLEQQSTQLKRDRFKSKAINLEQQREGIKSSKTNTPSAIESSSGGSKMIAIFAMLLVGAGKAIADNIMKMKEPKPYKMIEGGDRTIKGIEDEEMDLGTVGTAKTPIDRLIQKQKGKSAAVNAYKIAQEKARLENLDFIEKQRKKEQNQFIEALLLTGGMSGTSMLPTGYNRLLEMQKDKEERKRKNREMERKLRLRGYAKGAVVTSDSESEEDDYMPMNFPTVDELFPGTPDEYDIRKRGIKDFRMNDSKKAKDIQKASPRGKLQRGLRLMNQKPSDTFEFNYRSTLGSIFTPTSAEGATLERVDPNELNAYLQSYGISSMHSAGIIANIERESDGFVIGREQYKGGPGIGLFQYEGSRKTNFLDFFKRRGTDWRTDWQGQVDFLMQEPNQDSRLRQYLSRDFNNPLEASKYFMEQTLRNAEWARPGAMKRMETKIQQLPFFRKIGPLDNFSTDGVINNTTIIGPQQLQEHQALNIVAVKRSDHGSYLYNTIQTGLSYFGWGSSSKTLVK